MEEAPYRLGYFTLERQPLSRQSARQAEVNFIKDIYAEALYAEKIG